MTVSVIIPTHKGAEEATKRCVYSIEKSSYKDIEIIVVDEGFERSKQRNIGIDRAKSEYLLFLDSDMIIHHDLIYECIFIFDRGIDAIYIPEEITTVGWFGRLRNWERKFYTGTAVDCVRFVRAVFCPRFSESLHGPEDSDWDRRVGGGVRTTSLRCSYHFDEIGVLGYFKKKAYYAESMARFKAKWPNDKILNFKWRCFGVFVENGKWKRLVIAPHLTVAMFTMIFIRGIIYLWNVKKS